MSVTEVATASGRRSPWPGAITLGLLAAVVTVVLVEIGALSLPGLAILALAGAGGMLAVLWAAPQVLIVAGPALIHRPLAWAVFPYELVFGVFVAVVGLRLLATRPRWAIRLTSLELAYGAFVVWALASGLWITEPGAYLLGVRRVIEAAVSLWVGLRLARLVSRPWFEAGLLMAAVSLTAATLARRMSHGLSENQLLFNRAMATDLGWATSNFIATLLLLLTPPLIEAAFRAPSRLMRVASWTTVAGIAVLQLQIASRAATVLFVLGVLVQLGWGHLRRSWAWVLAGAAVLGGLLVSPLGEGVLNRFSNVRDMGSMVVRIWYVREAWRRTIEGFPWGLGLNQGVVHPDRLQDVDPHNYWLVLSSELGLPGVLLWLVVLVVLHRALLRVARTPGWQTLGRALLLSFWLGQIHTLVEPTFQGVQYGYLFFWLMGGYLGYWTLARERQARGPIAITSR